jgi:hypothetical protein
MGLDIGPFSLEKLEQLRELRVHTARAADTKSGMASDQGGTPRRKLWIVGKFERLFSDRKAKDVLRAVYLMVILGAALALVVGGTLLMDWRRRVFVMTSGCAATGLCAATVMIIDRPVFRVLFPVAYLFFVLLLVAFPWRGLAQSQGLVSWRRPMLRAAMCIFVAMGCVGAITGMAQVFKNGEQQLLFRDFLQKVRIIAATRQAIVAWPDALPLQYQSPFVKYETGFEKRRGTAGRVIYQLNSNYGSHPARLESLKQHFGQDVYSGLFSPNVVHLVSSREQVEQLERFSQEHYQKEVRGQQLGEFEVGDLTISAWLLVPPENL